MACSDLGGGAVNIGDCMVFFTGCSFAYNHVGSSGRGGAMGWRVRPF